MKSKNQLSPEAVALRRAYFREYRRQHPEKMREYERRRWEKKAEQLKAEQAERTEEE